MESLTKKLVILWGRIARVYCSTVAKYKSQNTYPDSLELDFASLFSGQQAIRVAIIDDQPFPWVDALEARGCKVTVFSDYTKRITQSNQKLRVHDLSSQDIIICDINGVGANIYPGSEGLSIIEDLRRKNPLHVIAAYTGSPGLIYTKLKKQSCLDMVFVRDWTIDDFLLNFDALLKIFHSPKERWNFIRTRLSYLEVSETKLATVRKAFVENVILCQMLHEKFSFTAERTRELATAVEKRIDIGTIAQGAVKIGEIASLVSPFLSKVS